MSKLTSEKLVTIIGANGFVGRHVVRELAKTGVRIRAAVRRPNEAMLLRTMGSVGQIQLVQANIRDTASLDVAITGAGTVVNLAGVIANRGKQTFHATHEQGAENVARICTEQGVRQLVHMSALGADIRSVSKYSQSKIRGEKEVLRNFPAATILRPSVIFGPEDNFFGRFAMLAKALPVLPLVGGGQSKFQPIYVDDVADAVVAILSNPDSRGQTYELGGPRVWTLEEVYKFVLDATHRTRMVIPLSFAMAKFASLFLQLLPGHILRPDQVNMLREDNVVSDDAMTLADLGIIPQPAEIIMPKYLVRYRKAGAYERD
jgi:uncharacterized protein YbjT (DUF2867 family)